jgi:hypothetical protein
MMRCWVAVLGALCGACTSGADGPPTLPQGPAAGIAVVCSNWGTSTSVAILDPTGQEIALPQLIHSGSAPAKVHAALSGDVVLPTASASNGILRLIDRYPNGVITTVDVPEGAVALQIEVADGFKANPHDVLELEDGRLLVTRYNPNPHPNEAGGDDVVLMDELGNVLSALPFGDEEGPGRPDRLARVGDVFWVSLNRASLGFDTYQSGRLGRLALKGDGLERLLDVELENVRNCGGMVVHESQVFVSCGGSYVGDTGTYEADESALVRLDKDGVQTAFLGATDGRIDGTFSPYLAVEPTGALLAIVYAKRADDKDSVIRWGPTDDTVEILFEGPGPWTLTAIALTEDDVPLVAVGDEMDPKVCRLGDLVTCLSACEATGLPPRALGRYGF